MEEVDDLFLEEEGEQNEQNENDKKFKGMTFRPITEEDEQQHQHEHEENHGEFIILRKL